MDRNRIIIVLIIIAGVIASMAVVGWQISIPRYHLGTKEGLVSNLSEFFSRNSTISVTITNETSRNDAGIVYRYDLISNIDKQRHGWMEIRPWNGKILYLAMAWNASHNRLLLDSGYVMLSGIADNTIPDWQNVDGDPNRNLQMLAEISSRSPNTVDPKIGSYDNWDLSERRVWRSTVNTEVVFVSVFIES